ncbi:hypothetical protein AB6A40_005759 [Gnathostoma spinigerum]|uniref:ABC-type xenobiotic transporter n=1 Tax=Gnathostoma spinigerum TaxID=75299 RepID=A0ABD6ES17_9BILA
MATASAREAKKYASAGAIAEGALSSIRTVIAFNGQQYEADRYDKALRGGMKSGIYKAAIIGLGLGLTFLSLFSSYTLAFWVGTNYIYEGYIDAGTLLTVFFSVMMGSLSLGQAGPQLAVLGVAQGAAGAIFEVIDRIPEIDTISRSGTRPRDIKGYIKLKGVEFSYPTRPDVKILKGISLDIEAGQTVALVGSSGCGKSTIVSLLLRYYNQSSGKIMIDENDISSINVEYLRKFIGVVSQEPALFNMTIRENLRLADETITEAQMIAACRTANAHRFITQLPQGYDTLVGDRGTQLSGGQKQRIAIARALLRNPRILLLDEATSALDAESENIVQSALEKAAKGRTTIVIAHRLSTIRNADKIFVLNEGTVAEAGKHSELMEIRGYYYDLVNAQVFVDIDEKVAPPIERERVGSLFRRSLSYRRPSSMSSQYSTGDKETFETFYQTSDKSIEKDPKEEIQRLKKELAEEGGKESNLISVLRYARPEIPFIVLGLISCGVQGCVLPVFSLFFTEILNIFGKPSEVMLVEGHWWSLLFLVLGGVQFITMLTQTILFGIAGERLTQRLRSNIFRTLMRMDAAFFDMPNHSSGKLSTRLATDAPNVKGAIDYRLGSVLSALIAIGCGIGIAFYYGWQMALLVIAIFPLGGLGQALQVKFVQGHSDSDAKKIESSGKLALEAVESIRTVQSLTCERILFRQFCSYLDGPHRTAKKRAILQGVSYGFSVSIFFFLYSASFRFGLFLIVNGFLSPMHVMRVLFAISFTAGNIGFASAYFPEYVKAKFAAGIIFKMLGDKPKIDNVSRTGKKHKVGGEVDFDGLHFAYPQRTAVRILKNLNLCIRKGRTLALVGPSGCGKSTLVALLERFYDPDRGHVKVDSNDIRSFNLQHLRSQMALVSQEPILFDSTIGANISYGLSPGSFTQDDIVRAAKIANIHDFIESLPEQYDTRTGEQGTQLSGGQKQRIAIARALVRNPAILLLDEATSALDTESEKIVQKAIDEAGKGRTCIIVAHRLSTVVNADSIAVINGGVVVEQGTHSELMSRKGAYYALTLGQTNAK